MKPAEPIDPRTCIGHVHLKVSDLERAVVFYRDVLGFEEKARYGAQAAFLAAGGYHHHIGLNTWESRGGEPPPPGTTGLYHAAILVPDRRELSKVLRRLLANRVPLEGAADHGVSQAIYLRDPDGNALEIYCDRAPEEWTRDAEGQIVMTTEALDLEALLAESGGPEPRRPLGS